MTAFDVWDRFRFEHRKVIVTGAAQGLGLAVSSAFVGAGAKVAILDVDEETLTSASAQLVERGQVTAHHVDIRSDSEVARAVTAAAESLGGIDVLVNDAAIYPSAPLMQMSSDRILDVLDVNVVGAIRMVRAAHPWLTQSAAARIINFTSTTFDKGFPAGLGAYIASKGGVIGLTRALARELGPDHITVNSIAPGTFLTRAAGSIPDLETYTRQLTEERQSIPRLGEVEDIAAAALFLGSEAAAFITGQTLVVDGGWTFK